MRGERGARRRATIAGVVARGACLALGLVSCVNQVLLGVGPDPFIIDVPCPPMSAKAVGACERSIGYAWTGRRCEELRGCECQGIRCNSLYLTSEGCEADYKSCQAPPDGEEICGDAIDNNGNRLIDEGCPQPCPPLDTKQLDQAASDCARKQLGYIWDGVSCILFEGCGCEGPICAAIAPTFEACLAEHKRCLPWACELPTPPPGPDGVPLGGPRRNYQGYTADACAKIGPFTCKPGDQFFSDECGCGCIEYPIDEPPPPTVTRFYVSTDLVECDRRKVSCDGSIPGLGTFADETGCGCVFKTSCTLLPAPFDPNTGAPDTPSACAQFPVPCNAPEPAPDSPGCACECVPPDPRLCLMPSEAYLLNDPLACEKTDLGCPPNSEQVSDVCGCGCRPLGTNAGCPKPDDPTVDYLDQTTINPFLCSILSFECEPGQKAFSSSLCGCGCTTATDLPLPEPPQPEPPKPEPTPQPLTRSPQPQPGVSGRRRLRASHAPTSHAPANAARGAFGALPAEQPPSSASSGAPPGSLGAPAAPADEPPAPPLPLPAWPPSTPSSRCSAGHSTLHVRS
ncbi:MAG: hypothetical protein MUF34_21870 [Polyangiaceae bacterium]|nr:hypothetical protein [Polyangiaceae bacterium]